MNLHRFSQSTHFSSWPLSVVMLLLVAGLLRAAEPSLEMTDEARRLHASAMLTDGHNDLPWAFRQRGMPTFETLDIASPQPELHTDIPRLRAGGVKAQFWSVYVPVSTRLHGQALQTTLEQIDFVHRMVDQYPDTFALCLSVNEIERAVGEGKIASLIGVEGGHSIENSIAVLRQLYNRGARYMTLTHSATLDWADSCSDEPRNGGLSAFGEAVVREMNQIGMLVDLSHVSDDTMRDALRVTRAPVIFSHSSARGVASHPRNVPDDVLPLVRENGGVIMVNFYSGFVVPAAARYRLQRDEQRRQFERELGEEEATQALARWEASHPLPAGTIHDVVDHIDHLVRHTGIDHVGIGSDYDGIGTVPKQLEDVSKFPLITQELLNRGYSHEAIRKILGENVLRVFREAERVAAGG